MSIRYLNKNIKIQEFVEVQDASGDFRKSWNDVRKCWAHIDILFNKGYLGTEQSVDKIISTKNYFEITIRSCKKINNKMRILYKDRKFNILKILDHSNQRNFIKIIAVEEL